MVTASAEPGVVGQLASLMGASEPAFRLLLTIVAGYPLALVHRNLFLSKNAVSQHLYFTICGVLLCCFNYGLDVYHSLLNILVVYAVLRVIGGTLASVALSFLFCMA
ncbi:unnamed protein product, partial [Ixodes hexagonus]